MDIHCRYCGEPWDHDELHEIEGHTYKQAAVAFRSYGCGAFNTLSCGRISVLVINHLNGCYGRFLRG